nr:MAG TPA: hypothetical protein [Caudoviricetes sp.]
MCIDAGTQVPSADENRFTREGDAIAFLLVAIFFAAIVYFVYAIKADFDESFAVIDACRGHQTFECMDKAREEYRRTH